MAGFTTHYIFGSDIINNMQDEKIVEIIEVHRNVFNLGLQGPDIFFYNAFMALGSDHKKIGRMMHKSNTGKFFENVMIYLNHIENKTDKDILIVYFYGLLAHYSLDMHVHPYVYYRSNYIPNKDNAKESFGMHSFIEINVDKKYLVNRKKLSPSEFYQHKTIKLTKRATKLIIQLLTFAITRTYFSEKKDDYIFHQYMKKQINLSLFSHKLFLKILHDKYGLKRKAIQFIENHLIGFVTISNIILTDDLNDMVDSMNFKHKRWYNPWNSSIESTDSFHDLYKKAGNYYFSLISKINIENKMSQTEIQQILKAIGNYSYHTGLKCDMI